MKNFKPRVVTYGQVNKMVAEIYQKYPDSKFSIYECPFQASILSMPVSYKIYYDGRSSADGVKIGVCNKMINEDSEDLELSWREVASSEVDREYAYKNRSTPITYTENVEWWKTNPPGKSLY